MKYGKFENILVYFCMFLVNIAYLPNVLKTPLYSVITGLTMFCVVSILLLNVKRNINTYLRFYFPLFLLLNIIVSIVYLYYGENIIPRVANIFLVTTIYLFGYSLKNHSKEHINVIIKVFCFSSLLMGVYSVYINLGSFYIVEDGYAFALKNSSGVLLGTSTILALNLALNHKNRMWNAILWLLVSILLFICLLTFRCRSASVAVLVSFLIIFYKLYVQKRIGLKFLLTVVAGLLLFEIMGIDPINYIVQSFTADKDISDLESLSSGRTYWYSKAIEVFANDVIGANLSQKTALLTIDNFVLSTCAHLGIWGIIIYFPPYVYLWSRVIKHIIHDSYLNNLIPYLCLLILLIVSLFEASFPFGPGTSIVMAYFLIGYTDRMKIGEQTIKH